jgi:hypothetical protein
MSRGSVLSCPAALDRFVEHLDGELGTGDGRVLEAHLRSCDSCLQRARDMAGIHRDLLLRRAREAGPDPIPALRARIQWDLAAHRRPRRSRVPNAPRSGAAVVVAAVAVAACLLLLFVRTAPEPSPRRIVRSEPAPIVEIPTAPAPAPAPLPPKPVEPKDMPLDWTPAPRPAVAAAPDLPPPAPESPSPAPRPTTLPEAPAGIAQVVPTGRVLFIGDTLPVDGPTTVLYPDGTRLFLSAGTAVTFEARGKTIAIARGDVVADVTPQPPRDPLMLATAGAEVRVVGTIVAVSSRSASTVVAVEKGLVQVTRKSDRWSIPVREGHMTTVEPGRLPVAKPLAENLLADPGFESDGKAWGGFYNRSTGRNYGGVSVTPDVFRSGRRALQLIPQPTPGLDREVFQDVAVAPGDSIEISGWLRTAGVGGPGIRLSLLWLVSGNFSEDITETVRSKGQILREEIAGGLTGTCDWTRFGLRAVAPPQARQVRLLVYADVDPGGPSTAWADDLILRRFQKGK